MTQETIERSEPQRPTGADDEAVPHGNAWQSLGQELSEDVRLAAGSAGCEILEADFRGGRLQIVLDHPEGTTLAHCEEVSKKISALLDVSDFSDSKYILEVSSPGLDRKLYGTRDYVRFAGQPARVTWDDPVKGKRTDVGRLGVLPPSAAEDTHVERVTLEVDGAVTQEIPLDAIIEARLEVEI